MISRIVASKTKKKQRKFKYTQKAGTTKLGRCYVEELPNGNLKLILGRRKYITKYFNNSSIARNYIYEIAKNPNSLIKNKCIEKAQQLDKELKEITKKYQLK